MVFPSHPEVLAADWLPPTPCGREESVGEVARFLSEAGPGVPPIVIEGPSGSGTSTVARCAALVQAGHDRDRGGSRGRVVSVRVRWCTGTTGVAGSLLRSYDDGFREQGFSIAEIMAGFLRRTVRDGRPVTVILDDLSPGAAEIGPVVRALSRPERFLPEGIDRAVPLRLLLVGSPDAGGAFAQVLREGLALGSRVRLDPYAPRVLREIVLDRASRAMGATPSDELVGRIVHRAHLEGRGASRAVELLREELLGSEFEPLAAPFAPREAGRAILLEPRILRALGSVCARGPAEVARIRAWESRLARADGARPLPATTFWRRIVRLEQAGLVRREVRSGGPGGSRSVVRLLRSVESWSAVTVPPGTPREASDRLLSAPALSPFAKSPAAPALPRTRGE